MKNLKALLLDMDGLLIDSERVTYDMWRDLFAAQGHELTMPIYLQIIGKTDKMAAPILMEHFPGFDPYTMLYPQWEAGYAELAPKGLVPLKEGVFELLDFADAHGIKKAVVSSNHLRWIEEILKADGVYDRMDLVVHGRMVEHGKPEPEIFLLAAELLGLSPEECLVLEDSNAGITAGHRAGMQVICIPDLKQPAGECIPFCSAILPSLKDVPAWLSVSRNLG